jgi:DNA-binding NarL/FixJ family response regulator
MIKVCIADDHALMREGLRHILSTEPDIDIIDEAKDGEQVIACARRERLDVVLLDLSMPGESGVDLICHLHRQHPGLAILVLTMYDEIQYAVSAIKAGARGFLTKGCDTGQLLDAVRLVHAGHRYISTAVAERLALDLPRHAHHDRHRRLSQREFEVFSMLASGSSVSDIACSASLSVKTVSTHKMRLMQKLQIKTLSELVQYAVAFRLLDQVRG